MHQSEPVKSSKSLFPDFAAEALAASKSVVQAASTRGAGQHKSALAKTSAVNADARTSREILMDREELQCTHARLSGKSKRSSPGEEGVVLGALSESSVNRDDHEPPATTVAGKPPRSPRPGEAPAPDARTLLDAANSRRTCNRTRLRSSASISSGERRPPRISIMRRICFRESCSSWRIRSRVDRKSTRLNSS